MRTYRFHHVDVFADQPLAGNPLAVFPEAEGLSETEMQRIAGELNLPETTFVLPPTDPAAAYRVRIFTPARELPFAGHPLVGTPWVMAREGRFALRAPRTEIHHEVVVGTLPVVLEVEGEAEAARVTRVVMTQGRPRFEAEFGGEERAAIAAALGVPVDALGLPGLPPQVVSTGLDQLLAPLPSPEMVAGLEPDLQAIGRVTSRVGAAGVYAFALPAPGEARARYFAPLLDIPEDPATGSAAGCLGACLAARGLLRAGRLLVRQGIEMGRSSRIEVEVEGSTVRVAGRVVPLVTGALTLS